MASINDIAKKIAQYEEEGLMLSLDSGNIEMRNPLEFVEERIESMLRMLHKAGCSEISINHYWGELVRFDFEYTSLTKRDYCWLIVHFSPRIEDSIVDSAYGRTAFKVVQESQTFQLAIE